MLDCVILSCHPFCDPADNSLSSVGISATEYYWVIQWIVIYAKWIVLSTIWTTHVRTASQQEASHSLSSNIFWGSVKFFVQLDLQCIARQVADLVSNCATERKVGWNRCLKYDGVLHSAKFPAICLATFSVIAGFVALGYISSKLSRNGIARQTPLESLKFNVYLKRQYYLFFFLVYYARDAEVRFYSGVISPMK